MSAHPGERLCAYLDGELPTGERVEVEAHLAACPACTALLADLAVVDAEAASLPVEAPKGYFEAFPSRVTARLGAASRAPGRARRLPAWTWAAAAALLVAVVAPLTLRRVPPALAPSATPAPAAPRPDSADAAPKRAQAAAAPPDAASLRPARPEPAIAPPPAARPAAPGAPSVAERRLAVERPSPNDAVSRGVEPPPPTRSPPEQEASSRSKRTEAPADSGEREEVAQATNEAKVAPEGAYASSPRAPGVGAAPMAHAPRAAGAAAGALSAPRAEGSFERLEASRPRAVAEWRRLRDDWVAFASSHPDDPRADEARVRAIEAGREAWLAGGAGVDLTSFLRDARAYLERADAAQKPRVERLLAEPRRTP